MAPSSSCPRAAMILVAALLVSAGSRPATAAPAAVLVWPRGPGIDPAPAEREVTRRGLRSISFAGARARLTAAAEAAARADDAISAEVASALADARTAYLEQRYGDMLARLTPLEEGAALEWLARPAQRSLLWAVEFHRGLAHLARRDPGDDALARSRFRFAVAIDPGRRPVDGLYGPDVARAFDAARLEADAAPALPLSLDLDPPDARVAVDGVALVDPAPGPALVREGFHVVWAWAPGRAPGALVTTVSRAARVRLALPVDPRPPIERLGPAWQSGQLGPTRSSDAQALRAAASSLGAGAILWLDRTPAGEVVARAIAADGLGAEARAGSMAEASRRALATLGPSGRLSEAAPLAPARPSEGTSIARRWWFWTAVGAAVAGGVAVALLTSGGEERLRIEAAP